MSGIRIHRSAEPWRVIFAEQASSGLTQQAFCDREGIAVSTFTRWRQRLSAPNVAEQGTAFIELPRSVDPDHTDRSPDAGLALRLELGPGVVLELRRL